MECSCTLCSPLLFSSGNEAVFPAGSGDTSRLTGACSCERGWHGAGTCICCIPAHQDQHNQMDWGAWMGRVYHRPWGLIHTIQLIDSSLHLDKLSLSKALKRLQLPVEVTQHYFSDSYNQQGSQIHSHWQQSSSGWGELSYGSTEDKAGPSVIQHRGMRQLKRA